MKALPALFAALSISSCQAQEDLARYAQLNASDSSGQKQGIWIERYDNGSLKAVRSYSNDLLDGASLSFTEHGQLQTYSTYVRGKKHGLSRAVDPLDGTVRVTQYDQGVIGLVKVFDAKGNLVLEEIYSNGALTKSLHHTPTGVIEGTPR